MRDRLATPGAAVKGFGYRCFLESIGQGQNLLPSLVQVCQASARLSGKASRKNTTNTNGEAKVSVKDPTTFSQFETITGPIIPINESIVEKLEQVTSEETFS